jgi:RNA polymerase sigma factor (sigma-70 family)
MNNEWDLADEDLNIWLNAEKHAKSLPLSDILKSAYIVFRRSQTGRLREFCKLAFDYHQEQEKIRLVSVCDNQIMFSKSALPESERKARNLNENNRIITAILAGDQKVFNDLYEYEFPKVVRLIKKNSGDIDSAKDIFQDALVILIEKANRTELDLTCSFNTYLYSICKILWKEQLQRDNKTMQLDDSYNHLITDIIFVNNDIIPDIYDEVNNSIEKLGDSCKQLLECYYYKKMSWIDIANTLGYKNAESARNQKYKCLEKIRKMVGSMYL